MNYENKGNYLFYFMTTFMIGCVIITTLHAEQDIGELPTGNTYSISGIRTVEIRESKPTNGDTKPRAEAKRVVYTGGGASEANKGNEKRDQGQQQLVLVKGFPDDSMATNIATYAYKISGGDMDFLMTLKAENGGFDMLKQSNVRDKNGPNGREDSRGLCQLHRKRHKDIVDTRQFWESWEYQVEICWQKYKGGTRFYGYDVRKKYKDHFTIVNK